MSVRVFGQPELHRHAGVLVDDTRIGMAKCGLIYVRGEWPKAFPRPPLPRCSVCFP